MRSINASNKIQLEKDGITDVVRVCKAETCCKVIATIFVGQGVPSIGEVIQPEVDSLMPWLKRVKPKTAIPAKLIIKISVSMDFIRLPYKYIPPRGISQVYGVMWINDKES